MCPDRRRCVSWGVGSQRAGVREQMITDLARPLRLELLPPTREGWRAGAGAALDVDQRPVAEPLPLIEKPRRLAEKVRAEGRIEEHELEGTGLAGQVAQRIRVHHHRIAGLPLRE